MLCYNWLAFYHTGLYHDYRVAFRCGLTADSRLCIAIVWECGSLVKLHGLTRIKLLECSQCRTACAASNINAIPSHKSSCSTSRQTTSRSDIVDACVKKGLVILDEASYCGPVRPVKTVPCFYGQCKLQVIQYDKTHRSA